MAVRPSGWTTGARLSASLTGFGEILQEMKAVGHLGGLRCARTSTIHIGLEPISGGNGHLRMRTQPAGEGVGLTVMQQGHWPPTL